MIPTIIDIDILINTQKEKRYIKDYNRIKSGMMFNSHFENYTRATIKEMVSYFQSKDDYQKSSYLLIRLNNFTI